MNSQAYQIPFERATIITRDHETSIVEYLSDDGTTAPLLLHGDCREALSEMPPNSIDCVMTSPPYWGHREYDELGIGLEDTVGEYISNILDAASEIKRVLKPEGSFWLNLGDRYINKRLMGIPWRIAIAMMDTQGWILRNEVIWNKVKGGPDNSKDKLRNTHEQVFHFVRSSSYFYDADSIRSDPKEAKVVNGAIVTATGVTGIRYKRQIELSTSLSAKEKQSALTALDSMLDEVRLGELADFRMIIRGQQRVTHSNSTRVSGRAKELEEKGFYFLKYHPNGAKPSDVWDVIPEDTQKRTSHFSPYPLDLCRIPIASTCPEGGIALDPFCGTGTTLLAAMSMGRRSIGIDVSHEYLEIARQRCSGLL